MKYITKLKLAVVHLGCDTEDKSTEFMIQFMQDTCKVDYDTVIAYLTLPQQELDSIHKNVIDIIDLMNQSGDMMSINVHDK